VSVKRRHVALVAFVLFALMCAPHAVADGVATVRASVGQFFDALGVTSR
jgi:hypothetical protein